MLKKLRNRDQIETATLQNNANGRNKVQILGRCFNTQNENFDIQNKLKSTKSDLKPELPLKKSYKLDENVNYSNVNSNSYNNNHIFPIRHIKKSAELLKIKKTPQNAHKSLKPLVPITPKVKCKLLSFYDYEFKRSFSIPSYKESDLPFFKHKLFQPVKLKSLANDVESDNEIITNGTNYVRLNLKNTLIDVTKNANYLNKHLVNKIQY